MATITKTDLDNIKNTPEARRARRLMASIEQKLNHDGRYAVLTAFESGLRMGKLTNEESEFWGALNGWDTPYYSGIDWDSVSTPFLAACVEHSHGTNVLQYCNPAPSIKSLMEALGVEDAESFLRGEISLSQLDYAAIPAVAIEALRDGELYWADLAQRYPAQVVQP
jgi:hypothetical protein